MRTTSPDAETPGGDVSRHEPRGGEGPVRRAYRSPRLERHGRLAEVTRFGGSQIIDSGAGLGQAP